MRSKLSSKRVLFIGGNFAPELTGIGKYNGEMVSHLANYGYSCTVVTSFPYYPHWKVQKPYSKNSFWYKKELQVAWPSLNGLIEVHRCPQYVPRKPSGIKRIILDFSFFIASFFKVLQLLLFSKKYDYVITVVPGFQLGLLGVLYKMLKGGKFIYHIQDLQIDAAREMQLIKSRFIINTLLKAEKFILKRADIVSSISSGMIKRIQEKHNREVVLFPNWVDTSTFYPIQEKVNIKKAYGFLPTDKVILYSGAIGEKQGLEQIIYTAKVFQQQPYVKFIICGSGPYKERLQLMADELGLKNVIFLPLQPYEKLNDFLNVADVHLVLQKSSASDLVMPSKLTTILSVGGVAIVTGAPESNLYEMISANKIGILVNPDNMESLAEALNEGIKSSNDSIKRNARKYAEDFLSTEKVFSRYIEHLN